MFNFLFMNRSKKNQKRHRSYKIFVLILMSFSFQVQAKDFHKSKAWNVEDVKYFEDALKYRFDPSNPAVEVRDLSVSSVQVELVSSESSDVSGVLKANPKNVYKVFFDKDNKSYQCSGVMFHQDHLAKNGSEKEKKSVKRLKLIEVNNCVIGGKNQSYKVKKYVSFPVKLPFGLGEGYELYRQSKEIQVNDKEFACMSTETIPGSGAPLKALAMYRINKAYIFAWETQAILKEQGAEVKYDYPIDVNGMYDRSSIEQIVKRMDFMLEQEGRGQVVFKETDCSIKKGDKNEIMYMYCSVKGQHKFYPKLASINVELKMKQVKESYYWFSKKDPQDLYSYVRTDVTIEFIPKENSGVDKLLLKYQFKNKKPTAASPEIKDECKINPNPKS